MRRWKKITVSGLVLSFVFASGVYADAVIHEVRAYLRPDFQVALDGNPVVLQQPILIYNNSSYVPLKAFGELTGNEVLWDNDTSTIHLNRSAPSPSGASDLPASPPASSGSNAGNGPNANGSVPVSSLGENITLNDPMRYEFDYQGNTYDVLANIYEKNLYVRANDIRRMNVDISGLPFAKERVTGEWYIPISALENRWGDEVPLVNVLDGAVIEDETDEDKIDTLRSFRRNTALYVRSDPSESDVYTIFTRDSDRYFILYTVKLRKSTGMKTGYALSNVKNERIENPDYDRNDDDDDDD